MLSPATGTCLDCSDTTTCKRTEECHEVRYDHEGYPSVERFQFWKPKDSSGAKCELCGEPMPPGEEQLRYHGLTCDCPKPPLQKVKSSKEVKDFVKSVVDELRNDPVKMKELSDKLFAAYEQFEKDGTLPQKAKEDKGIVWGEVIWVCVECATPCVTEYDPTNTPRTACKPVYRRYRLDEKVKP